LFVVGKHRPDFLRTIPVLQRDEKDPDDFVEGSEDQIADETRYALTHDRTPGVSFQRRWIA